MYSQTTLKRNYSITNKFDEDDTINGRCPSYALNWQEKNNQHWPNGHNYFIVNG